MLFYNQHFYKQQQAEIEFEIIINILNERNAAFTVFSIDNPAYMSYAPHFYKKILIPLSMIF